MLPTISSLVWRTVCLVILAWGAGILCVWYGRKLASEPLETWWIFDRTAVGLARIIRGHEIANELERILRKPARVRKIGARTVQALYFCFVLGGIRLIGGVIRVVALLQA